MRRSSSLLLSSKDALPGFVLGGDGVVSRSMDGVTWGSTISMPTYSGLAMQAMAYSQSLKRLIGVASTGTVVVWFTSDDGGLTWSAGSLFSGSAGSTSVYDVLWASDLGKFFVSGADFFPGPFYESTDGVSWSSSGAPGYGGFLGRNLVLGVLAMSASGSRILYSSTGATWNTGTSSPSGDGSSMGFAPSLGANGRFAAGSVDGELYTSDDGVSWTSRTPNVSTSNINAFAWSPTLNLWVLVADGGKLRTSPDGITWTDRDAAISAIFSTANLLRAAWSPLAGLFAIVSQNLIATSPDGVTWTQRTSPLPTNTIRSIIGL